jgi:hypothetical protein
MLSLLSILLQIIPQIRNVFILLPSFAYMKKSLWFLLFILLMILLPFSACSEDSGEDNSCGDGVCDNKEFVKDVCPEDCGSSDKIIKDEGYVAYALGQQFVTYVASDGIGNIALQISVPDWPRYTGGAPVIIETKGFFTTDIIFDPGDDFVKEGFVHISYLWPGVQTRTGVMSEGVQDYGGEDSIQAFRDVILFALGKIPNTDGEYIFTLVEMPVLTDNVGLFAFSHSGIAATNVLALYANELHDVQYLVGRENPTRDTLSSVEAGHWDDDGDAMLNPYYVYPDDYSSTDINIDYSTVRYDVDLQLPYFDIDGDEEADEDDFILGSRIPTMYDKNYLSMLLTQALLDNGVFTDDTWPDELATAEEAAAIWPFRQTVDNYARLAGTDLKVMLVFAVKDHVQPAPDKPHVHQAFDGFYHTAGLWIRLNPDASYLGLLSESLGSTAPDKDANIEPSDWLDADAWAHSNKAGGGSVAGVAGVLEMADRVYYSNWDENLDAVLLD